MIQWRPVFGHMAALSSKGSWEISFSFVFRGKGANCDKDSFYQNANSSFYAMCYASVL